MTEHQVYEPSIQYHRRSALASICFVTRLRRRRGKAAPEKAASGKSTSGKVTAKAAPKPATAAPTQDWERYVVAAPEVRYPSLVERTGTAGIGTYVLIINPKNGEVTEVKVIKSAGFRKIDAIDVMNLFEWRFRPGTITSAQVSRGVSVIGRSRGYHSGRY